MEQKIKNTPIGEVITRLTPPDAINVVVLPGDKEFQEAWPFDTLCGDGVIIPIVTATSFAKQDQMWIPGGRGYGISRVTVTNTHHVEIGLLMTL